MRRSPLSSGRMNAHADGRRKVLIMCAYFAPESAAYIHLTLDLVRELEDDGFAVDILAPIPTRGVTDEVRKEYARKKREKIGEHVTVRRFWLPRESGGAVKRALRYCLQNAYQVLYGWTHSFDLLFLHSTPPTNGVVGGLLRKTKKVPFIYNVQDVFPDSMVSAGLANEGSLSVKVGRWLERFSYRNSDRIVVINNQMKSNLLNKGVDEGKLSVVYNWVDGEAVRPVSREHNTLFKELSLSDKSFIVTYAGNIGMAQGIDVIIEAARLLSDHSDIQFVIIGAGACLDSCRMLVDKYRLKNVLFVPMQGQERVSEVYSLGEASLVSCKRGFGGCGMPSKTCSIMATGTPVIASFDLDSELADMVQRNRIGIAVQAGEPRLLADAVLRLYEDRDLGKKCGRNGREFLDQHMSKQICCKEMVSLVRGCMA